MKDERRQQWIIVAVLFVTMFLIWGPINASSVFFIPVVKHFAWSRALFSLLVATAPLAAGFSSPALGSLMDRYGERRIMITGAAMVGLGFLALSRADSAIAFLAVFIVLGVGISASTIIPTALVLTNWFRERRGLALGVAFSGIPLGGAGVTILANRIVEHGGFRAGYIAMGLPILFVVIPLLAIFMRARPIDEGDETVSDAMQEALPGLEVREALRSRSFWLFGIADLVFAMAGVGLRVHLVPLLTGIGYSATAAAEIFGAMFLFSAVGTFLVGRIADRMGGRATLAMIFVIAAAGMAALLGASHIAAVAAFIVIFGLVRETPPALVPIALTESLGRRRLGTLLGILALFNTFGFAIGPVIAGGIFDRSGSYTGALVLFAALALIAMLAIRATLPLAEEKTRLELAGAGAAEPLTSR
ncbi:MAG TPA: MFS transporter [Candidatus Binataceae bacterium]|nr:MFS transporter [Candidatus Binataceae bacterium]